MARLKHLKVVPDGDRFKIVMVMFGGPVGRLAFKAAFMAGDGTGLTREEAEIQVAKLDVWIEAQTSKRR